MLNLDQIRQAQEQRLEPVLKAWDEAKLHLEAAIALAKARERDFQEVSDDVQRKLDALDLVLSMANGLGNETSTQRSLMPVKNQPALAAPDEPPGETQVSAPVTRIGGLMRRTSRPLFLGLRRSA